MELVLPDQAIEQMSSRQENKVQRIPRGSVTICRGCERSTAPVWIYPDPLFNGIGNCEAPIVFHAEIRENVQFHTQHYISAGCPTDVGGTAMFVDVLESTAQKAIRSRRDLASEGCA